MGYYTYYTLSVVDKGSADIDAIAYNVEAWNLPDYCRYEEDIFQWYAKWYEHEEDMKELSLRFPDTVFDLFGDGEDSDDFWHKYFKNGKMQCCPVRFEYDDYDERLLK